MLNQIPRPMLVTGLLLLGILSFFFIQEPTSVCDIQVARLKEGLKSQILPSDVKGVVRPPVLAKAVANCRLSNSPGACYEYFQVLRRMIRELKTGTPNCYAKFIGIAEVSSAVKTALDLMAQIAWGDSPPEANAAKFGWLESADLALFCDLRDFLIEGSGEEAWESLRNATYAKLPGEGPKFVNGKCANCDYRKTAPELLAPEEIWVKSLYSIRCEAVR